MYPPVRGGLLVISLPLAYYALLVTQDRHADIFRRAQAAATGVVTFALLIVVSLIFLYLVQSGRLRGPVIGVWAAIIIGLDLFSLGANIDVGHVDPTTGFDHPAAIAYLQENAGLNRMEVTPDVWHLWQPDTALLHGLFNVWGIYNPLTLADTTRYWEQIGPRSSAAYNLMGIKYIVAGKGGAPADGDIVPVFDADPTINIYLNRDALPRAVFYNRAEIAKTHEAAWNRLHHPAFDPATTVILEAPTGVLPLPASPTGVPDYELGVLEYGLHTVEIALTTNSPGYLFLSDAYYPGWQATVDGNPVSLYRANYAFRAVPVPAGEHRVRFEFKPLSWRIGLLLSGSYFTGFGNFLSQSQL